MSENYLMYDEAVECTGKPNTDKCECVGWFFGWIIVNGRKWAIVKWENNEVPDLYKADCLLVAEVKMVSIK